MTQIFFFDCVALMSDEWTRGTSGEPAELEDAPRVIGFFLSADEAAAHANSLEMGREARYADLVHKGGYTPVLTKMSYYIIPVANLKLGRGDGLCEIDEYLVNAARLMARGIGGAPLALPVIESGDGGQQ